MALLFRNDTTQILLSTLQHQNFCLGIHPKIKTIDFPQKAFFSTSKNHTVKDHYKLQTLWIFFILYKNILIIFFLCHLLSYLSWSSLAPLKISHFLYCFLHFAKIPITGHLCLYYFLSNKISVILLFILSISANSTFLTLPLKFHILWLSKMTNSILPYFLLQPLMLQELKMLPSFPNHLPCNFLFDIKYLFL